MDDRRFDNAVRALARHRSRRGLMGSLLGGGAALLAVAPAAPGAAAQGSYVPQGGWCIDDDQCDPWLDLRLERVRLRRRRLLRPRRRQLR